MDARSRRLDFGYSAPRWLPGAHLQTIWPALYARRVAGVPPPYRRERWTTPDGDFVDVDHLDDSVPAGTLRPLLVVFHGLEGSSRSHYSEAFADLARERGWACALPHFRGCSGEINLAPRAYHSGDHEEIGWMLGRLRLAHRGPLMAVGISLGGNALLRWAAEAGDEGVRRADAVAAVCAPLDLAAGGRAIGQGFNRQVYTRMFMRTLVPKALQKLAQHPGLFDRESLLAARDLYAFDNVFTAPLHGFRDTDDYWRCASAKPLLHLVRVPALALNALNDPFVPATSLPSAAEVGPCVELWQPSHGGHVGFVQGSLPGHVAAMPRAVADWLLKHAIAHHTGGSGLDAAQWPHG
ncbi:alpha/beta hydrolase fold protein [Acidovorax delafieldii 2AN]|uniref:Alpha/beta hydrolase fold protein n=1 Tax=Acidovorax delafieldii 2AN TaxID=573060 RepID=C5T5Z2_ACIDE|nr:alpha/beta fold hydrolase [Acidovorax delafieldii]EER60120.1 alpha/beta hydrolase fold protein [Acidovorax delafieldii 2AN]